MAQQRPVLITSETNQKLPILIIDKKGKMGSALAQKLQDQFLVVIITGIDLEIHDNLIHIPYRKKIPLIPDNMYSHMFIIYNGEPEITDIMLPIMKRANQINARVLFITSLLNSSMELYHRFSAHIYHDLQFVVYGEMFDEEALDANQLNVFIHQARLYRRIEIPDPGLQKLYPVFFDDCIWGIIAIAFSEHLRHSPQLVFPKHGYTQLSIGRMLQKIDPLIKSDFKKSRTKFIEYFIPENGEYIFQNYPLEDKLRKINFTQRKQGEQSVKRKLVLPQRKKNRHIVSWLIGLILFLLFMPPLITLGADALGYGLVMHAIKQAEGGKFGDAYKTAGIASYSFISARAAGSFLFFLSAVAPVQSSTLQENSALGQVISQTALDLFASAKKLQMVIGGESSDPGGDFLQALATIKNALLSIEKMRAENHLPHPISSKLEGLSGVLTLIENTIDSYPSLFGFNGKRTYLILFQNNMELRPGGGFIGSFATVAVENGKVDKPQVYDVYDADGKLTQHIEPPFQLRRYLGATHWFLRDSNFDPDFIRDGQQAMQFLQAETGQHVDGVIAIDTDFLKDTLSVFGSVWVPDYKETVSADNFYLLTQSHAENNFFPGSTQKKDFLKSLYDAILLQLSEKKNVPFTTFAKMLSVMTHEKHMLFAFADPATQKLFTVNDLSSSLQDDRQEGLNSFLDSFGVVDANLGLNKTNYYLKRSIQTNIVLSESGDATGEATITYQNTSSKNSVFGGDYKDYVRFILPEQSEVLSVAIDGQVIPTVPAITDPQTYLRKGFVPPQQLEIEKTTEEGRAIAGFLVMVPTGSLKTVSLTYTIHHAFSPEVPFFSYGLQLLKQPGTEDDPYSLFVSYPASFKPVSVDKDFADVGGKLAFEGSLSSDMELRAGFSRK